MRVVEAVRKPAAQTQTSPSPAGSQSQSQSLPGANEAAPAPETQPNLTGEGQSATPPVGAGQESQTNAAAGQAEGPPQSSAASAVKPQREPAEARAGQKDKDEAQKLREENQNGAVLEQVMPNVSSRATDGMRRPLEVELRVSVDEDGNVSGSEYRSLGPGNYFARIARQAVLKWKFQPPVKDGQARSSVWTVRFHFGRGETDVSATEVR
jgi:TonB family protein